MIVIPAKAGIQFLGCSPYLRMGDIAKEAFRNRN